MSPRLRRISIAVLFALVFGARSTPAGQLTSYAISEDGVQITVSWTYREYDGAITGAPQWVGYDLYRRTVLPCGSFERVNAEPFPRTVGATHGHTFVDPTPIPNTAYEYKVVFIDSNRQAVSIGPPPAGCDFCSPSSWSSAPDLSAPVAQGTLVTPGDFFHYIQPCPGSCPPSVYIDDLTTIEPYLGAQTVLLFYGRIYCGTVEGCGITLDRVEPAPCDAPVPVQPTAWGRLKTLYR